MCKLYAQPKQLYTLAFDSNYIATCSKEDREEMLTTFIYVIKKAKCIIPKQLTTLLGEKK